MTTVEVFETNQKINSKMAEMNAVSDQTIKTQKQQEIMTLVTQLCVAIVDHKQKDVAVM